MVGVAEAVSSPLESSRSKSLPRVGGDEEAKVWAYGEYHARYEERDIKLGKNSLGPVFVTVTAKPALC